MMQAQRPRGRIVVGGLLFYYPLAGVTWQHLHYLVGLQRLGWDVFYVETAHWSSYSYPESCTPENYRAPDVSREVEWVAGVLDRFGLAGRWHFHTAWDGRSYGMGREAARRLLREADAFLNVCASQALTEDHLECPRRLCLETDPVALQVKLAKGDEDSLAFLRSHTTLFTFGENLGTDACPLETGGFAWHPTRQPVLTDEWGGFPPPPPGSPYTTIGSWEARGKDVVLGGRVYHWQKGREFARFRDLPGRVAATFLLAMTFDSPTDRATMERHGWETRPALDVSRDLDIYRGFILASRGEFTAAKEQNIVFRTGWFSDRAATYLAAGRPVINQDTGFDRTLPVGEGLFSVRDLDDCVAAVEAIEADYLRHCRAARGIAESYFAADRVLSDLLARGGL